MAMCWSWFCRQQSGSTGLHIKQVWWASPRGYLQRRVARDRELALPCPSHLFDRLTNCDPFSMTLIIQGLRHAMIAHVRLNNRTAVPRSARSTRIGSDTMKLRVSHEGIREECLSPTIPWNSVVRFRPLVHWQKAPKVSGASKPFSAVAHRRFEAPSV